MYAIQTIKSEKLLKQFKNLISRFYRKNEKKQYLLLNYNPAAHFPFACSNLFLNILHTDKQDKMPYSFSLFNQFSYGLAYFSV